MMRNRSITMVEWMSCFLCQPPSEFRKQKGIKAIFPGSAVKVIIDRHASWPDECCFWTQSAVQPHWAKNSGKPGAESSNGVHPTTSNPLSPASFGENSSSEMMTLSRISLANLLSFVYKFPLYLP